VGSQTWGDAIERVERGDLQPEGTPWRTTMMQTLVPTGRSGEEISRGRFPFEVEKFMSA
jgi:cytochrome c556